MKYQPMTTVNTMSWKRISLFALMMSMLILEMVVQTSTRELRSPTAEKHGLRPRRINKERERTSTRLLRRLLQSAYAVKRVRNNGRQKYEWIPDYDEEFEGFGINYREKDILKPDRKTKGRKRFNSADKVVVDPVIDSNISCCPQRFEVIEPQSGRNQSNDIVQLYQDEKIQQRFSGT